MTRVLLAEDSITLLGDISLELELRGYTVMQAMDGQGVLDILRTAEAPPDIIVSDIAMPDLDGFKLLEHVRSDPDWENIPFVFISAFNSPNSIRIGKELGADDYIVKPFRADDLVRTIESKLNNAAAMGHADDQIQILHDRGV